MNYFIKLRSDCFKRAFIRSFYREIDRVFMINVSDKLLQVGSMLLQIDFQLLDLPEVVWIVFRLKCF